MALISLEYSRGVGSYKYCRAFNATHRRCMFAIPMLCLSTNKRAAAQCHLTIGGSTDSTRELGESCQKSWVVPVKRPASWDPKYPIFLLFENIFALVHVNSFLCSPSVWIIAYTLSKKNVGIVVPAKSGRGGKSYSPSIYNRQLINIYLV